MTAHRCCPECGAELTADGGKFCGCVGPFTAEHVDPMHIRPYVDLPEPEDEGSHSHPPDLEPFARCGQAETAELPALSEYQDPYEAPHGSRHGEAHGGPPRAPERAPYDPYGEPHPQPYGAPPGGAERDESAAEVASVSLSRRGSHRRGRGRGAYVYGQDAGAGRRRRPLKAALAAAGAVAALGGGLLTTQALTGDRGDDRNLSADDTAPPDGFSGGPTEEPSRTDAEKRDKEPSQKQTSRSGSAGTRADRDGAERSTVGAPEPSRPSSSTAPGTPSSPEGDGDGDRGRGHGWDGGWDGGGHHDGGRDRPQPPQESTQPGGETLRPGDSGPEVAELQRRLKQAGALDEDAPEDGVYSQQVQQAVAQFQARNRVRGDEYGEYGPNTRRVLESQTSG